MDFEIRLMTIREPTNGIVCVTILSVVHLKLDHLRLVMRQTSFRIRVEQCVLFSLRFIFIMKIIVEIFKNLKNRKVEK